jgi:hypothetical protein
VQAPIVTVQKVGIRPQASSSSPRHVRAVRAFRQGLERLGWSEGRNIRIHHRFAVSNPDQFHKVIE